MRNDDFIRKYKDNAHKRIMTQVYALGFFVCLIVFLILCIGYAYNSAGPVILGTEQNGDGSVEYLCLGSGCEDLRPMDW